MFPVPLVRPETVTLKDPDPWLVVRVATSVVPNADGIDSPGVEACAQEAW
jgi:hypothetical protein